MKRKGVIEGYWGPLTPAQAMEGINLAIRNARRLALDAQLMLDLKSHPTATSLASLAIEEIGKVSIIRRISILSGDKDIKDAWRSYRSHRSKNGYWIMPNLAAAGKCSLSDLKTVIDPSAEHTGILDAVKQIGLYTDCYEQGHWSDPEASLGVDLAAGLVETAVRLSRMAEVSLREMELWVQHLASHYGTKEMPHALMRWHSAMVVEGLARQSHEEFAVFVFGDKHPAEGEPEPSIH